MPSDAQEDTSIQNLGTTLLDSLRGWAEDGIVMLPNAVVALLVLIIAWFASRFISNMASRALDRFSANRQVNDLLATFIRLTTLGIGLFTALSVMHLDGVVASMLAGVGVVGLALGFAFKDIAANLMSGVLMAMSRPFRVGDLIRTQDYFGTVERVDLRVTHLRTLTGEKVLIPNQNVYNQAVINYTETRARRMDLEVGVSYHDDLAAVRDALRNALAELPFRDANREVKVLYTGFGASSIDLVCQVWLDSAEQISFLQARSEAIIAVKQAVDEKGFTIPFPIRTLDFGAEPVGGERLDTVLRPVFGQQAAPE